MEQLKQIEHHGVAIIGGGQAAGRLAIELRQRGYDERITIFAAEPHRPYERPALSKDVLTATGEADPVWVLPEGMDVDLRLGATVKRVMTDARTLTLADGSHHSYVHGVFATGGDARRLDLPSDPRILALRDLEDAHCLRALAQPRRHAIILGAGVIGLEVASSLRKRGLDVTVLEQAKTALGRALPDSVAKVLVARHEDQGTVFRFATAITDVQPNPEGLRITCEGNITLHGDFLLQGLGLVSNDALACASGIDCDRGIRVDPLTQATATPGIYAIGDVARPRAESWAHANESAARAAAAILKTDAIPSPPPWFWTDQAGVNVQAVGSWNNATDIVERPEADGTLWLYLEAGQLIGAIALGCPSVMGACRRAIGKRFKVPLLRTADVGTSIRQLLKAAE